MIHRAIRWFIVTILTIPIFACDSYGQTQIGSNEFESQARAVQHRREYLLHRLRFGTVPDPQMFQTKMANIKKLRQEVKDQNENIRQIAVNTDNCRKFLRLLDRSSAEITRLSARVYRILEIKPWLIAENGRALYRSYPYEVARLQIVSSLLTLQNQLVQSDSEAGFGILDPQLSKKACTVQDRNEWKTTLNKFTGDQLQATFALIGAPGLSQMAEMNDALAQQTATVERSERWQWWAAFSVEMAVSVALWKGVPLILKVLAPALAAANVPTVYATRVLALSGEALMIREIEESVLFVEKALLSRRTHAIEWQDMMNEMARLLDAPMQSPRLYAQAVTQVYASMSRQLENLLDSNEYRRPTSTTLPGPP